MENEKFYNNKRILNQLINDGYKENQEESDGDKAVYSNKNGEIVIYDKKEDQIIKRIPREEGGTFNVSGLPGA